MRTEMRRTVLDFCGQVQQRKMDRPLEERDLKDLMAALHPLRAKWRTLGVALEASPTDLDAIELNSRGSVGLALEEILSQWLRSHETRTWPDVVEALDRPFVGERRRAKRVRDDHCEGYVLQSEVPILIEEPSNDDQGESNVGANGESDTGSKSSGENRPPCDRRTAAILLAVISSCIVFAFGGITLMAVGIRGFAEDDDYKCSLGPHDLFNSLNFITGFVFLTGLLILILVIFLFFFQHFPLAKKIIGRVIIGTVAGSLVLLVGDMIFSFYVASELLPGVEKWERNQSLCNDGIFRSSFGVIVTYFIVICVLMVVGAVILSAWIYRRTSPYRHQLNSCIWGEDKD